MNTKHDNEAAPLVRGFMRAGVVLLSGGLVFDAVFPGPGSVAGIIVCAAGIVFGVAVLHWMRSPRRLTAAELVAVMLAGPAFRRRLRFIRAARRRSWRGTSGGAQ